MGDTASEGIVAGLVESQSVVVGLIDFAVELDDLGELELEDAIQTIDARFVSVMARIKIS